MREIWKSAAIGAFAGLASWMAVQATASASLVTPAPMAHANGAIRIADNSAQCQQLAAQVQAEAQQYNSQCQSVESGSAQAAQCEQLRAQLQSAQAQYRADCG